MSALLDTPRFVTGKTPEELNKALFKVSVDQGGRVQIISIYFDTSKKQHVAWYNNLR